MKKKNWIILLAIVLLLFAPVSCRPMNSDSLIDKEEKNSEKNDENEQKDNTKTDDSRTEIETESYIDVDTEISTKFNPKFDTNFCNFTAQYIRTNGGRDGDAYPIVKIIRSVDELNAYYETNKGIFSLERRSNNASNGNMGFLDACDKYDTDYFEEKILVLVVLQENSGSNRHEVTSVERTDDCQLTINIHTKVPEIGTCDMAQWHIIIELDAGIGVVDESDINVNRNNINLNDKPTVSKIRLND